MDWGFEGEAEGETEAREQPAANGREAPVADSPEREPGPDEGGARRRRRRRRGGRRGDHTDGDRMEAGSSSDEPRSNVEDIGPEDEGQASDEHDADSGDHEPRGHRDREDSQQPRSAAGERNGRSRRRGRRGGRRGRDRHAGPGGEAPLDGAAEPRGAAPAGDDQASYYANPGAEQPVVDSDKTRRQRNPEPTFAPAEAVGSGARPETESARSTPPVAAEPETAAPAKRSRSRTSSTEPRLERIVVGEESVREVASAGESASSPTRKGWWQRRLSGE
jgi:ribonuclease E